MTSSPVPSITSSYAFIAAAPRLLNHHCSTAGPPLRKQFSLKKKPELKLETILSRHAKMIELKRAANGMALRLAHDRPINPIGSIDHRGFLWLG